MTLHSIYVQLIFRKYFNFSGMTIVSIFIECIKGHLLDSEDYVHFGGFGFAYIWT